MLYKNTPARQNVCMGTMLSITHFGVLRFETLTTQLFFRTLVLVVEYLIVYLLF